MMDSTEPAVTTSRLHSRTPTGFGNEYNGSNISGGSNILGNIYGDEYIGNNISGSYNILGNIYQTFSQSGGEIQRAAILQALSFEGENHRGQQIICANPNSFNWIWNDTTLFLNWLKDPDGTFLWITGGAGSGKSTLMKYLGLAARTRRTLGASGGLCNVVRFFFDCDPARGLANSPIGMLKSLLRQLLQHNKEASRRIEEDQSIDISDLSTIEQVLDIIDVAIGFEHYNICALLDGLDEIRDTRELLDAIVHLQSRTDIKICLASRPHIGAHENLAVCPRIVMENHNPATLRHFLQLAGQQALLPWRNPVLAALLDQIYEQTDGSVL